MKKLLILTLLLSFFSCVVNAESVAMYVYRAKDGLYYVKGSIKNIPVKFLIDTGANQSVIGSKLAKNLGINYKTNNAPTLVNTARGSAFAYRIMLKKISLGKIELTNVKTLVIEEKNVGFALLGMSALKDLELRHKGDLLQIIQQGAEKKASVGSERNSTSDLWR